MKRRQEIEDLLESLYAARVRGDLDTITALFAPDAIFQVAGSDQASPMPTLVKGSESVKSLLHAMIATFALSDFTILDMLIDGSSAAVRWQATVNHTGTDQVFSTEVADFLSIEDGRIVSFIEFIDTALAARVLAGK